MEYIAKAQKVQHDRAVRGTQVIQRFASTLCLREVRTRLLPTGIAPAWSTSNTITFSEGDLADLGTVNGVLSFKGLSIHEISHILFTPRAGSTIVNWVMDNKMGRAFNALEDQRIETLLVGRFGSPIVPWLTATVVHHILSNPQSLSGAFALVRGRKYLPVELRRMAMDAYGAQQDVAELSSIIDEYRTLLFPADTERAQELIARYAELVKHLPEAPQGGCDNKSADSHESTEKSRPMSARQQKQAQKNARERDEQDETEVDPFDFGDSADDWEDEADDLEDTFEDSDSETDDDESTDTDGDSTEPDGDDDAPTDESGDEPGDDSDEDGEPAESESKSDEQSGSGAGNESPDEMPDPVADLLNDILDEVIDRLGDDIRKDIKSISGDIELESTNAKTPPLARSVSQNIDPVVATASRSFGQELERLRAKFDPSWERMTKFGKLNASRFMRNYDIDEVFDKFQQGREDVVDIEAVILLDISGSMQGDPAVHASNAMWGIKRALDKVQASTTVLTFNSDAQLLYSASEQAGITVRKVEPNGGTNPTKALKYAQRLLAESERAIKIVFVITDGEWSFAEESEEVIKVLRTAGILTSLAYIGYTDGDIKSHGAEIASHISHPRDLLFLGRSLVKIATERLLTSV